LGLSCQDIDIAIDNMTGIELANELQSFRVIHKGEIGDSISKILSNPEKSKHLETATTKIYGIAIDFVNLRTEIYPDGSRVPIFVSYSFEIEKIFHFSLMKFLLFHRHSFCLFSPFFFIYFFLFVLVWCISL